MSKLQRCPGCDKKLLQKNYFPSCWGIQGQPCRKCQSARAKKWRENHPEVLKQWRQKQGRLYTQGSHLLNRYGITKQEYANMLERQHYRCLGCQQDISKNATVDHNHTTGVVRGILCQTCNFALGSAKEDRATLRRLTAYLDYDRTKTNLYVIGALKNPKVPKIGSFLREHNFDVFDEWYSAGPEADSYWMAYEKERGHTYAEALNGRSAQNVFLFDRAYLDLSDGAVLVMPAGKSAMIETGYLIGSEKPVFILLDSEPERYDIMPRFAAGICHNHEELLVSLNKFYSERAE